MNKKILVYLVTFLVAFVPVSARKDKKHKNKAEKATKSEQAAFREDHPVFGDGRLHPVHNDKVIGKFKNADKIKKEIAEIDEMEKTELDQELAEKKAELEEKLAEIAELRKNRLEKIRSEKEKLEKAKANLEEPTDNPVKETMNKLGLFINNFQMDQVEKNETQVNEQLSSDNERVEQIKLLQSYIQTLKNQ